MGMITGDISALSMPNTIVLTESTAKKYYGDEDYIPAFDLELLAGRNFSPEFGSEDLAVIINQRAVDFLEFPSPEDAIDKKVNFHEVERLIVGVIADYLALDSPVGSRHFPTR